MEGPPLGPGGEDITWPDQEAPRGRKASSTRKIKPQTSHDPLVTTAHSGRAEGGFRSAGAHGRAVHGPPLTPLHPGAAPRPRPQAHAGGECADDARWARIEYRRPPPGRGAGRLRRDPPPHPPSVPQAVRAPAPNPRGRRGWSPPPPERGARARPAPPPQPPAPTGAAENKRARANAPGRRTNRAQRRRASTNWSSMGGQAPHGQKDASDTRIVACPGKAEGRNEAERPPALQAPPRPHKRGVRRTPPPPSPSQPRAHPCHPPRVPPEGERCCAVRDRHPPLSCTRATQPHPRSPFPGFAPLPHRHIPRAYSWPCRCAKGRAVASVSTQGTPRVGGPECC